MAARRPDTCTLEARLRTAPGARRHDPLHPSDFPARRRHLAPHSRVRAQPRVMRPRAGSVLVFLAIGALIAALGVQGGAPAADASYSAASSSSASLGARPCYPKEVRDSPTFHYSFNEPSGATAEDGSGNGNDGTIQGTTVRQDVACSTDRSGSYVHFDGVDLDGGGTTSMVSTPVSATNPSIFTIETWFRAQSGSLGGPMIGFGDTRTDKMSSAYDRMLYLDNGQVEFGVWTGAMTVIASPSRYDDGVWHMAQAALSSSGMELYVDGGLVAANPGTINAQSYAGWWRLGNLRTTGWTARFEWNGDLDDVAVYSTRLTAAQVAAHYAAGR